MKKTTPNIRFKLSVLTFFCLHFAFGQYQANLDASTAQEAIWVDSIFDSMSPQERLGQLFMYRAYSNQGSEHQRAIESLIRNHHIGNLCFFQGTPEKQIDLLNRYQSLTKHVPLMIAIDGEWGLGMRLKSSTISYPRQIMLGAIRNNRLIYDMGKEIARQMHRVGIHVNFAPVVDVNNNPNNPVIGSRSFGEDRLNVTVKSYQYMMGMQDHGIMACAKHFPGHGDTDVDSHYGLPVISHDAQRLDSIELYPFRALIDKGIGSMMVAHLHIPALDDRPNRPTTLSDNAINQLLRNDLNFHGLTFTDAMDMKGLADHFPSGTAEAEALLAGNDILVLPGDIATAKREIQRYVDEEILTQTEVDRRVKRILRAKYRLGLQHFSPIPRENVRDDLNTKEAFLIKQRLIENALTLVRNEDDIIPFGRIENSDLAAVALGISSQPKFQDRLLDFVEMPTFHAPGDLSSNQQERILGQLEGRETVIVSLHDLSNKPSINFGVKPGTISFLQALNERHRIILVVFGNPYSLKYFDDIGIVLEAYQEDPMIQDIAAQALFGVTSLDGRLPITASPKSTFNTGVTTRHNFRMGYSTPEETGLNSDTLQHYATQIAEEAISAGATPGCVVLVARKGNIVFHEAFGHHTYKRRQRVKRDDVYDLASVTKIAASTIAIMDLYERNLIELDKPLGDYIPSLRSTNKENMTIREILAHQAGLKPWIPFYETTLTERTAKPSPDYYREQQSDPYTIKITDDLFLHQNYEDSIYLKIADSDLRSNKNYRYSDLGFYLMAQLVHEITGTPLDQYVSERFYKPMGLENITFNPTEDFSLQRIPPTEEDRYWRHQKVHGYVHDMGAAMLGGVSGHAGLFGNAHDVAIIMQMLLQQGHYAGQQYFSPETVREFTTRYPNSSRRGLGFDMKQLDTTKSQNVTPEAGSLVFGHLGFTGICTWADPETDLVFVFLSNRTYPSMRNNKLARMDIRPKMQSVAYRAMIDQPVLPPVQPIAVPGLPAEVKSNSTR